MEVRETVISWLWALFATYTTALDPSLAEIERHLEMGRSFLMKGQYSDALTHYHAAVDLQPNNYQTLYKRATTFLAMGKSVAALPDLDLVIKLKPDFSSARLQRANVLLKQGNLDEALIDYEFVVSRDSSNAEAHQKLSTIEPTRKAVHEAEALFERGDLASAEHFYDQAIEVCPWDSHLRRRRAECYEATGQIQKAIQDIRSITKLEQDSTDAFYRLSVLYYNSANIEESLNQIRECLKLNPDDQKCFPHYKKVRKLEKMIQSLTAARQKEDWPTCIQKANDVKTAEAKVPEIHHEMNIHLCRCLNKAALVSEAIDACTNVLKSNEDNFDVLCDRAEAYIQNEQFEEAVQDYQKVINAQEDFRRAKEGLHRAQKLLKQSKKRDYYKILGVKRTANKQEITKAYRKLAQQWHPDQHDGEGRKIAEKKFIDIAAAKEVLTDPDKRARFDQGEDPLDAEQQSQAHQHPFYGFNPFGGGGGGGPFQFKFHFN